MFYTLSLLLFLVVLLQAVLFTAFVKNRNNTISLSIPVWVMLLWLFKGSIDFSLAESIGVNLRYESELFPVKVDGDYFLALLSYYLYYFSYMLVCIYYIMSTKRVPREISILSYAKTARKYVLLVCALFVLIYFYYGLTMFREAMGSGLSIYHYSRFNGSESKPLMTLASWIAVASGIVGFGISIGKTRSLFLLLVIVIFLVSAVLGNRHILLSGMFLYIILFQDNKEYNFKKLVSIASFITISLTLVMSIYVVREVNEGDFSNVNIDKVKESVINMSSSSEFIYAHMSMYGVLSHDVEPSFGQSLIFLTSATLPRFISNSREPDIYTYYINRVNENPYKGFSIANPTGWYLNFGVLGLVLGGAILGFLLCLLHRLAYYNSSLNALFFLFVFSFFVSDTVGFMRSGGPEPLRAVLLIKSVIPALILFFGVRCKLRIFTKR